MTQIDIFNVVQKNILEILPFLQPEVIQLEKKLSDLGANSVDRMDIIISSMEDLNLKIPLLSFVGVTSICDLVFVLKKHVM